MRLNLIGVWAFSWLNKNCNIYIKGVQDQLKKPAHYASFPFEYAERVNNHYSLQF
jgi:hypothetical protein